jgi:hypothetical protein
MFFEQFDPVPKKDTEYVGLKVLLWAFIWWVLVQNIARALTILTEVFVVSFISSRQMLG